MQDARACRSGQNQSSQEAIREYVDETYRRRDEEIPHHGCESETRRVRVAGHVELDLPVVQTERRKFARRNCEDVSTHFSARNSWERLVGTVRRKSCGIN